LNYLKITDSDSQFQVGVLSAGKRPTG